MGSKLVEEPKYSTEEINKEIDSYFKHLVKKHIKLQTEMFTIEDSCYHENQKAVMIPQLKTKMFINIESQQLLLELMWFLSHLRDFPGGRAKHMEHIYGEMKWYSLPTMVSVLLSYLGSLSDEGLYEVLKEKYNNLNRSENFNVNDLVKKMEKLKFSTDWMWKILYLLKKNTILNIPSENRESKRTDEISTDIETIKSKHENLENLIYATQEQQENLIQDMNKIKEALEEIKYTQNQES